MVPQAGPRWASSSPGYTPLLVLLTPPGVETCLDRRPRLCSANSDATLMFRDDIRAAPVAVLQLSLAGHRQHGRVFDYVVQPLTAHDPRSATSRTR